MTLTAFSRTARDGMDTKALVISRASAFRLIIYPTRKFLRSWGTKTNFRFLRSWGTERTKTLSHSQCLFPLNLSDSIPLDPVHSPGVKPSINCFGLINHGC